MKKILPVLAWCAVSCWASSTTTWELTSFSDFIKGRFSGVSLTRDGRLMLAPRLDTLFSSDQAAVWSVARAQDGTVYAGTGHKGRVYRIDPSGKGSLYWTADQPEIFAVAVDAAGILYAGTSPDGKVYRIENGKAQEYFAPQSKYIWSLAISPEGGLFVGTGDNGKIYRVTAQGQGEVYYETGQSHVTCLGFDTKGQLLAGTEPNGILYRVSAKDKAFVMYDAGLPEIRSVATAPDGSIYVAALGGAMQGRGLPALGTSGGVGGTPMVTAPGTSITVTDTQAGLDIKPKADAAKQAQTQTQVTSNISPVVDVSGVEKSAIYRINPDNTVETLWSSKEENVYDLLLNGGQVVFATDLQGRIYRLGQDRKATLIVQTNESETTRLLNAGGSLVATTGNMGKIYRMVDGYGNSGYFESPVHDSGSVARWGHINWQGKSAPGASIQFRTRSGNSARPDKTWSEWSSPLTGADSAKVTSPNARYVQWRAEFSASQGQTPVLDSVSVTYLPQNTPPVVRSISVTTQTPTASAQAKATSTSGGAYSITVSDSPDSSAGSSTGTPTQTLGRTLSAQLQVTWVADDPDGDKLVYTIYFRGEDEREWKLLKANTTDNTLTTDADVLADGRYFFRVVASDRLVNPAGSARESDLVSSPVLIDNTPPVVKLSAPVRQGAAVELDADAVDAASPLRRAEYSVDAGPWTPLEALDGVIDSKAERFHIRVDNVPPGEHIVVVRAYDAAGNAGLAKAVVR